ncbi:hypothetical protein SmJEL517_g04582 [Synchytrium microbalum]|uniref:FAD linked oxidase N-terminal domain-containing protein n=1 Tax=Synchytrium microbalum TaxID=1806994 RepID=A0A507BYV2_9FUNG|nr:uncharacterized protein SmJEL517_g04582 [Synchytrium microbalum]TPX32291.1 hypothetical protein SmJEL517_g04582 [Synchytrium microbalum]
MVPSFGSASAWFALLASIIIARAGPTSLTACNVIPSDAVYPLSVSYATEELNYWSFAGRIGLVGVGGLLLGNGLSFKSTQYGWASNNIVNYEIVLADGSIVNANANQNSDLFAVLKGGGNNFGIVSRFTLKAYPQGQVWGGIMTFDKSKTPQIIKAVRDFTEHYPDEKAGIIITYEKSSLINTWICFFYYNGASPGSVFRNFTSIGPLLNSAKTQTYYSLLQGNDIGVLHGFRYQIGTETLPLPSSANIAVLQTAYDTFFNITDTIISTPFLIGTIAFQPIPKMLAQKALASGGDSLSFDPTHDYIIFELDYSWTGAAFDTTVQNALTQVYTGIRNTYLSGVNAGTLPSLTSLPLFANDAYLKQDYFGRLPVASRNAAKLAQTKPQLLAQFELEKFDIICKCDLCLADDSYGISNRQVREGILLRVKNKKKMVKSVDAAVIRGELDAVEASAMLLAAIEYSKRACASAGANGTEIASFHPNEFTLSQPFTNTSTATEGDDGASTHKRKRRRKEPAAPSAQQEYAERDHLLIRHFLSDAHSEVMGFGHYTSVGETGGIVGASVSESAGIDWLDVGKAVGDCDVQGLDIIKELPTVVETVKLVNKLLTNSTSYGLQLKTELDGAGSVINIPPNSTFLMSDLSYVDALVIGHKYNLIVIDFPWPNSSVHSKYDQLDRYDMFKLPVNDLIFPDGLVVFWMTNTPRHHEFVRNKVIRDWKLTLLAEWYWCKVTSAGEWVRDLDDVHRKPYEKIIIASTSTTQSIPSPYAIFSVPSSHHSRKPSLEGVLKPYLPKEYRCLELFARNLLPNWTSWGNEVLKFQTGS